MFLADAAPTGSGLAIVGVILLVFLAFWVAVAFFTIRFIVRRVRRRRVQQATPDMPDAEATPA